MREFKIDANDVVRWESNGNVPPKDIITEFLIEDKITSQQAAFSVLVGEKEQIAAVDSYIQRRKETGYTDEEKSEIRANFGGEKVINILTGEVVNY